MKDRQTTGERLSLMQSSIALTVTNHIRIFVILCLIHIVLFYGGWCIYITDSIYGALRYMFACVYVLIGSTIKNAFFHHEWGPMEADIILVKSALEISAGFVYVWLAVFVLSVPVPYFTAIILARRKAGRDSKKEYVRGVKFITPKEIKREFKRKRASLGIPLGSFRIPKSLENRHFFTIGLPGTGKSQMLRQVLKHVRRKDKCIVFDYKGEFFSEFYDEKRDLLFNPLDKRSVPWNVFNEFRTYTDIEAFASSLIPPSGTSDSSLTFWPDAARFVFTGIIHYLWQSKLRTNAHLWRML